MAQTPEPPEFPPDDDTPFGQPEIVAALSTLQEFMLNSSGVESFLVELSEVTASLGGPGAACGVTVRRNQAPFTFVSSSPVAERMDQEQYTTGEGPCIECIHTGEVVMVRDVRQETRWPRYVARVLDVGPRGSVSSPLRVRGAVVGAVNVYVPEPEAVTERFIREIDLFAAQASAALELVERQTRHNRVSEDLEKALASRSVIDQAMGVLMALQKCTAEEAFRLLRSHSRNNNRKVRDVAADIVRRVSGSQPSQESADEQPS